MLSSPSFGCYWKQMFGSLCLMALLPIIFNSYQEMALRVFYIMSTGHVYILLHNGLSAPSFGRYCKQPILYMLKKGACFNGKFLGHHFDTLLLNLVKYLYSVCLNYFNDHLLADSVTILKLHKTFPLKCYNVKKVRVHSHFTKKQNKGKNNLDLLLEDL